MSDQPQPMPVNPEEEPTEGANPAAESEAVAEVAPPEDWLDWQENLRRGRGRRVAVDVLMITAYLVLTGLVVMGVWWWRR